MDTRFEVTVVLLLSLVAANLPFVNERLMTFGPRLARKGIAIRLLELLLWCALSVGVGFLIEAQIGQRHPQEWPFYVSAACLFLTFAFPGFVWRHLRRVRPSAAEGSA